jgi:glycosyltransferase involved in cell wall biosynthesis
MKIVHYLSRVRLADGGVVRAVLDQCAALARLGNQVTLMTRDAADVPAAWREAGGEVEVVDMPGAVGAFGRLRAPQMSQAARALNGADILHMHVVWDPACVQLNRLAHRLGVAVVISTHGMLDTWSMAQKTTKKRVYLALGARRMLREAGAVHCTADAERDQSVRWHGNARTIVVPLVFDVDEYERLPETDVAQRAFPALDTGRPILLFLSRLHEKKRPELVVEAAGELARRGVETEVAIAGPGDDVMRERVRATAERAGIADRVHLLGMVSGEQKVALYRWARVFVLPTSQENFGFVLIEALAAGTPVVTTKGVDIWSELLASGGVEVVDPPTPEAMAGAIGRVLTDRERMSESGRAWALREFWGGSIAGRYGALYEEARSS